MHKLSEGDDVRTSCLIPPDVHVIHPLNGDLLHVFDEYDALSTSSSISIPHISTLNDAIRRSAVIWQMHGAAVLQISPTVALKRDTDLDIAHISTLNHIRHHAPSLPIPRTFGVLIDRSRRMYYHFMTYFPGPSLETHWIHLSDAQKKSVKEQLEPIFQQLRKVPSPPLENGRLTWGSGVPRRCIDTRRWERIAKEEILDEKAFNDFLTTRDRGRGPWIKMVRSFMREDHACAMTHADLHPRNIVVQLVPRSENGASDDDLTQKDVKVLGVIDWDKSGWYPEYWEFAKALSTIGVNCPMQDWWQYLPHSIGLWPVERSLDLMIWRWYG